MRIKVLLIFVGLAVACSNEPPADSQDAGGVATDTSVVDTAIDTPVVDALVDTGRVDGALAQDGALRDVPAPIGPLRVFVSSGKFAGDFATGTTDPLLEADRLCRLYADNADLGGDWKAWLSSTSVNAIDRILGEGPFVNLGGGTELFRNRIELETGSRNFYLATTEEGREPDFSTPHSAWTGTRRTGRAGETCGDWQSADAQGTQGYIDDPGQGWSDTGDGICTQRLRFYCFEQ